MTLSHAEPLAAPTYTQITACRSCGSSRWTNILSLGDQYLIGFVRERNPLLPRCPLELIRCDECGLIQLKHSVDPELMWRDYGYRSSINATMRAALADVVKDGMRYIRDGTWLDIGANDGALLSNVASSFTKIAVEPARNLTAELEQVADTVIPDFFSAAALDGRKCDVITSCAMFYDLDDPNTFVADIAKTLSEDGVWMNQLSYTPTMLEQNAFDNIVHEHRCYYDLPTLDTIYRSRGLRIVEVSFNDVNGGSVRVAARHEPSGDFPIPPPVTLDQLTAFAARIKRWKNTMIELLDGRFLWGCGASTKGSVLLQYLGVSDYHLRGIGDRNPLKHGLMMPGVWSPIMSEEEMRKRKPDYLLVLPWSFADEITARESALRSTGTRLIYPLPDIRFVV